MNVFEQLLNGVEGCLRWLKVGDTGVPVSLSLSKTDVVFLSTLRQAQGDILHGVTKLKIVYAKSIKNIKSFDCRGAVAECIVPDEIYGARV